MKHISFTFLHFIIFTLFNFCIFTLYSCNDTDNEVLNGSAVKMTFSINGDFTLTTSPMTRTLTADNKEMTDVWVLDYQNDALVQQVHQTSADADFGQPTLSLAMGTHHLYFVASRGQSPVLDTDAHTLTFSKVLDTFWKDYTITVSSGTSSGSRSVALDRIVTRLKVTFSDAIPTGASIFTLTPTTWYYGLDYTNGNPTTATTSRLMTLVIPNTSIGKVNEFVSLFGFSGTTEWTTDVAISCKDGNNNVIGSAVIDDAPFLRNRSSDYTGQLFTAGSSMTLSLNSDWATSHTGSW